MKKLLLVQICLISLVSSCLYTKNAAIKKFCKQDSIPYSIIVHDTFVVKSIKVDTFFNATIDTFTIIKDRIEIRYKKIGEKIFIQGECKGDTIYKTKFIQVNVPVLKPKLAWWEIWYINARDWLAVIGVLAICITIYIITPRKKT